jgi:hypothetical protein
MNNQKTDFEVEIEQVKTDLADLQKEVAITEAVLTEKRKHIETLQFFLDTIDR